MELEETRRWRGQGRKKRREEKVEGVVRGGGGTRREEKVEGVVRGGPRQRRKK